MAVNSPFSSLPDILCSGSSYEIGLKHGRDASERVHGTLAFYADQFQSACNLDWPAVQKIAMSYELWLIANFPSYLDEMKGVADGSNVTLADILAVNVRTEINFGMFSDGCTSLSWKGKDWDYLSQNWDWMEQQKASLIRLSIWQPGKPTVKMVTEAGLIGKIGLNSAGVGVCFNAIRALGSDFTKIPVHLALRTALESNSQKEAIAKLERFGVASSVHILIADAESGGVGLECTHLDIKKVEMTDGRVEHANHLLLKHPGIVDTKWIGDSEARTDRIKELAAQLAKREQSITADDLYDLFKDESGLPGAICRRATDDPKSAATLFNVIMDLKNKTARYRVGRPRDEPQQDFTFDFQTDSEH